MDDKEIIELYFSRNEIAIEITSKKFGNYCFDIANAILHDTCDSEECVNDTWYKAWESIPPARPNSLKLFLARITRNISFNKYKLNKRAKRGGGEIELALDEIAEFVPSSCTIDTEEDRQALTVLLNRFLKALPKRDSSIFVQRYFFVDSIESIAKAHGLSVNNTATILFRSRKKLKVFLQKEGYTI